MTREEVINILNDYDINFERNTAEEIADAHEMAIKALESQPSENELSENEKIAEAFDMAIKAIRTIPSENEKIIRIKKGTLKVRTGRYVIYDVEWLKEHYNTTEAKLYGQPCEDCTSRKTGHWVKYKHNGKPYFKCSECLYFAPIGYSYCPGCGAKMQEVKK